MAQVQITQLPAAGAITGSELVPIVQNGVTVRTTTGAISASPSQNQTFLTLNQEPTLPNSRFLSTTAGLGLTDGGAQSTLTITLNGASGSLEAAGNGLIAKTASNTVTPRSITITGAGLSITDGDGIAGDPTLSLSGLAAAFANIGGTGIVAVQNGTTAGGVSILGTAGQINVANGNGSGNPTISLPTTGVVSGSYGSASVVSTFTVDDYGRLTAAGSASIAINASQITNGQLPVLRGGTGASTSDGALTNLLPTQVGQNGKVLATDGATTYWASLGGVGTVTSVAVDGGTTGLTTSGSPITSAGTITLGGTLNVANGGTGAVTLTGYVKGNGTSAMTAAATIPNTDITGLGTMSTQNAGAVAITGGTIDGTTIGGSVPGAGTFTSVAMTTGTITTLPVSGNDIVNRTYADSIAAGINFHQSVKYATTAALPAVTYANGTGGVGATLTANANGALTIDGYTFTSPADNGTRILIKNQASQLQNGVYTLTQAGDAVPGTPFILTRATDFDSAGSGVDQIDAGDFFLVTAGTANANTSWVQQTPLPITVGTTAIVFAQFGAPIVYSAGTGLTESPAYTFNIGNTTVVAGSYGGAATAMTLAINAQGQITSATDVSIAISGSQITSGTVGSSYISGSYTGITGVGTLTTGTWNANPIANNYLANSSITINGSSISLGGTATITANTPNSLTFDNSGTGVVSGSTFNGGTAVTVSYNTVGAPKADGTGASGTWGISISGNADTATTATNATNVAVTADSANATRYLGFYSATTGNLGTLVDSDLTYNPSTNTLTTATVVATTGISGGTF
jgi:hypothetical protein